MHFSPEIASKLLREREQARGIISPVTSDAQTEETRKPTLIEEPKKQDTREAGVIYAPMSGSIKSIPVQIGQTVIAGQALVILEAMKMENEITAPRDGTIKQIHVSQGAKIRKNEALVTLA